MKFVLIGPPGSGKGTQAEFLNQKFDIPHIKPENVIAEEISNSTAYGKKLKSLREQEKEIPETLYTDIILAYIDSHCPSGFTLDGFPKTVYQAERLQEAHAIVAAILLDVPEKEIIRRLTGLRVCPRCNKKYQIDHPSKKSETCDVCGGPLSKRKGDSNEKIILRIQEYFREINSIKEFYAKKGVLYRIDGSGDSRDIFNAILNIA